MTPADKSAKAAPSAADAKKKKGKKAFIPRGRAYIQSTYNNTIITITDPAGNVLAWSSAGRCGFKGAKKSTPYAAGEVMRDILEKVQPYGIKEVDVFVRGVGSGREGAIRALTASHVAILIIRDVTPIPHNGPRPRKPRRI